MELSAGAPPPDEAPDYRTFDLHGSHAHLGYVLGKADPPFRMQFWWWPPPPARFAEACRDVVHEIHPHLVDELHAYADAQRLPARELWRKCCRVNLKARLSPAHTAGRELAEGCSTFVRFISARTASGDKIRRVIVGRNYDYLPQQARRQRIRFVPDCCANASIGARGSVPCGRYDGLNSHGLFASLHVVMTETPREDEVRPGVPFHLVLRIALELCRTAREARDLLTRIPHLSSLNYLVADARDACVIEADPRRVRVIERDPATGSEDILAATNHFRHPDMRPLQGHRTFANSECRLAFLQGQQARRAGSRFAGLSVDALLDHAEAIMADRSAPVCGLHGSLTTLWSCVAELTTKRIRYAAGPPCFTPYEEMPAFTA
ncbi:MAG: C45 family peptidase [Anaerolineae bacterium]|nr:C45 family peptidase [Candidatus Roseilinea sp.]MDW8448489.1 C45 family peptidase [Anaerolineae bacterium]